MAYLSTSDSIIINCTLTEKGKKLLARGKFNVAKFALGDDEIRYDLIDPVQISDEGYVPALTKMESFEAYKSTYSNISYGLDSFDSGMVNVTRHSGYATDVEIEAVFDRSGGVKYNHAYVEYLPILKINKWL